jgi:hypothetical protein
MIFSPGDVGFSFELSEPFRPLEQLMGVLPPASRHALPPALQRLMTDEDSPIIDFYPQKFKTDMNGKKVRPLIDPVSRRPRSIGLSVTKVAWLAVVLLPFIEADRLQAAIKSVEHTFTDEERRRNSFGRPLLCVGQSDPLHPVIAGWQKKYGELPDEERRAHLRTIGEADVGSTMAYGKLGACSSQPPRHASPASGELYKAPEFHGVELAGRPEDFVSVVMAAEYQFPDNVEHVPKLRESAVKPEPVLTFDDVPQQTQAFTSAVKRQQSSMLDGRQPRPQPVAQRMIEGSLGMGGGPRQPCRDFQLGRCSRPDCRFSHDAPDGVGRSGSSSAVGGVGPIRGLSGSDRYNPYASDRDEQLRAAQRSQAALSGTHSYSGGYGGMPPGGGHFGGSMHSGGRGFDVDEFARGGNYGYDRSYSNSNGRSASSDRAGYSGYNPLPSAGYGGHSGQHPNSRHDYAYDGQGSQGSHIDPRFDSRGGGGRHASAPLYHAGATDVYGRGGGASSYPDRGPYGGLGAAGGYGGGGSHIDPRFDISRQRTTSAPQPAHGAHYTRHVGSSSAAFGGHSQPPPPMHPPPQAIVGGPGVAVGGPGWEQPAQPSSGSSNRSAAEALRRQMMG